MSINISIIEKDFDYVNPDVFRNQIPSSRIRPGFHVDNYIYERYTKCVEQEKAKGHDIREGDIFREIITRFALGHFINKETVNREIYDTTVLENDKLTDTVTKLTDIINKHDLTPKGQNTVNHSSDSWPTNTQSQNTPNANHYAQPYAMNPANGYAVNPARHSANSSAVNPANMADIHQREAAFALLFQPIAEYIQMLDMGININQLAIWLRFKIGLQ